MLSLSLTLLIDHFPLLIQRTSVHDGARLARTGDRMQVDVVGHAAVRMIAEMELDDVTFAHANELTRNLTAECPEVLVHSVGQALHELTGLQVHDNPSGVVAFDGRGNVGRMCENGFL